VISTSKIKNIIAIKKNRIEKGIRADLLGSNPHSNGVNFSRSLKDFFLNSELIYIKRIDNIKQKIKINIISFSCK